MVKHPAECNECGKLMPSHKPSCSFFAGFNQCELCKLFAGTHTQDCPNTPEKNTGYTVNVVCGCLGCAGEGEHAVWCGVSTGGFYVAEIPAEATRGDNILWPPESGPYSDVNASNILLKHPDKNAADSSEAYPHYYKSVARLKYVDVYRILALYNVTDPTVQHAIKKLLVAGGRGAKEQRKDIEEAIASLQRGIQIRNEDEQR